MKKLAFVLLLAIAFPAHVYSEPRHRWYKDWRNWALIGVSVAASGFATHEIHACRQRNDLIHCPDGGYGEFRAREELRLGTSLGMAALSVYGREHWKHGWKNALINNSPVIAISGYNLAVGLSDRRVPTFPKLDK